MSEIRVSSRYAKALLDLSKEANNVSAVHGNMQSFIKILNENHQLRSLLKNPIVTFDKKIAVMSAIFSKSFEIQVMKFIELMLRKSRGQLLESTAISFVDLYNELNNITKATVRTANKLNEQSANEITKMVSEAFNKTVLLEQQVEAELIGGVWLKVGDRLYDGSIKGKLQQAKKDLLNTYISK
jgi:F-type H+-transporting ATPase subunit delta